MDTCGPWRPVLVTFLLASAFASPARGADYTFLTIDVPGATDTGTSDINDLGEIVGTYTTNHWANGCHGYIRSADGTFTTVDYPGAASTFLLGNNNVGQAVGYFSTAPCGGYGTHYPFLYANGVFTPLPEVPSTYFHHTEAQDINDAGLITGAYVPECFCTIRGFLLDGGNLTNIAVPGYDASGRGINNAGTITGIAGQGFGGPAELGFILSGSEFTPFDSPITGGYAHAMGINSLGDVVGYSADGPYLRLADGTIQLVTIPGISDQANNGINTARRIVGDYYDGTGHGFIATPTQTYNICTLYDGSRPVKANAVVPIKVQLCDDAGANLSAPGISLNATAVFQVSTSTTGPVQTTGNANPDLNFRYDTNIGGTGGYAFNLKTTGLGSGTFRLLFTTSTGDEFSVPFQVK